MIANAQVKVDSITAELTTVQRKINRLVLDECDQLGAYSGLVLDHSRLVKMKANQERFISRCKGEISSIELMQSGIM